MRQRNRFGSNTKDSRTGITGLRRRLLDAFQVRSAYLKYLTVSIRGHSLKRRPLGDSQATNIPNSAQTQIYSDLVSPCDGVVLRWLITKASKMNQSSAAKGAALRRLAENRPKTAKKASMAKVVMQAHSVSPRSSDTSATVLASMMFDRRVDIVAKKSKQSGGWKGKAQVR